MKRAIVILLAFGCLIETRGATNRVIQSIGETKYWMPEAAKLPDASILFRSDMQREVKAFGNMKNKLKPLVKNWAAVYLNQIKDTRSRTLYVGPFAENVLPVVIYDYEGASFWEVGNVKSFEDPVALPPVLVTKIHTFDFLLAGISDANSRAAQQFLIKWQVANCVIDGMRVEVTSDDIAKAQRHSHPSMSELNLVSPFNKVVMPEATFFLSDTVIHGNVVERSDDASALSLDEEVGIDRSYRVRHGYHSKMPH